jgi:hypothetical protein
MLDKAKRRRMARKEFRMSETIALKIAGGPVIL